MKLYGTFKDSNNDTVQVIIYNTYNTTDSDINIDTSDNIRFGEEPVIIQTDCEDSFTHVIKTTCQINLVSKIWLGDYLYANNAESVIVNVIKNNTCLFAGYVTPGTYNQDFSHDWENLEINCIDYLSVLEYKYPTDDTTYEELKANATNRSFKYFMQKMKLDNNVMVINNLPPSQDDSTWVTTGYEITAGGDIVGIESNVGIIDSYTAVKTGETRTGLTLQKTWIQSEETCVGSNGKIYYKEYAWVTINGVLTKTTMWRQGQEAAMPTVDDTFNTLIGWTYGPLPNWFEYYDYYRVDFTMSDGSTKQGYNDTIGDQIPETPQTTSEGSYFEFRQGDVDDLDYNDQTDTYFYKNYAWIIQTINGETVESKTTNWRRGNEYIPVVTPSEPINN